jgi:hypothetical protein
VNQRRELIAALLVAGAVGWPPAARADTAPAASERLAIGETAVRLLVEDHPPPGVTYVHLHENERTAAEATAHVLPRSGGRLVGVRAQGQRLISFAAGGRRYTFDPNRIFTPAGVSRTLRRYSADLPPARAAVTAFAERVLRAITAPAPTLVIAPHNNTRGGYSIRSYVSGGPLARDAARVHVGGADPDDFCLVTEVSMFERLARREVNVVLQDPVGVDDDGSLAVACQRRGLRYVNVEARDGHLRRQVALLELVRQVAGP